VGKIRHYREIRAILIRDAAQRRRTITFDEVQVILGRNIGHDYWARILDPMAKIETDRTGHDLTKLLTHSGGTPRYFSDIAAGELPGSKVWTPRYLAAWKRECEAIYDAYKNVAP
jgi:hypothetical protein